MEETLLDKFAMSALTALMMDVRNVGGFSDYAEHAYQYANAMMEERKKHIKEDVKEDDEWIAWNGGNRPVDPYCKVEIFLRNGNKNIGEAGVFGWSNYSDKRDIIKYRVIK